jgi:DNA-binding MarR family transcriptional regulator
MKTSDSKYCSCLYFTANALARKVEKIAIESWKKVDLSPSHAYLLMLTLDEPGIQAGRLAEQLQLTPSTVSRLLQKLETKKLVIRAAEGKQINVYPTQKAKEMKPLLKECIDDASEKYSKILSKEESKQLIKNMSLVADKIED